MGMVRERLPPAVQDGDPTDLAAQMLPIGGDGLQGPDRGFEQDGIDDGLVLEGDRPDRGRHGEHDVEVGRGQEVLPPRVEPGLAGRPLALRAMPVAAAVVGDAGVAAIAARFEVATKLSRAAQFNGAHDARLDTAERTLPIAATGRAVAAEDIRHVQHGAHVHRSSGRRDGQIEAVQRALRPGNRRSRHMGVARRRRQIAMAQQDLDDPDVCSALQKVGGKAMAQRVDADPLGEPCCLRRRSTGRVETESAPPHRRPGSKAARAACAHQQSARGSRRGPASRRLTPRRTPASAGSFNPSRFNQVGFRSICLVPAFSGAD